MDRKIELFGNETSPVEYKSTDNPSKLDKVILLWEKTVSHLPDTLYFAAITPIYLPQLIFSPLSRKIRRLD